MTQNAHELIALLADRFGGERAPSASPWLIAIDGRSGAGKSTFAETLVQCLDAELVSVEDFFAGGTELREDPSEKLADICIDRTRLKSVLEKLKSNQPARYKPFDWAAFDGTVAKMDRIIHPHTTLVLEGVYSNHPDLRKFLDYSILLCVPEQERQRRLVSREGKITKWERQWHRGEDWYFKNLARPEDFDVVTNNH
ncbi:MAG: uridine kinase family protein [Hyphococcus sp.]